MRADDGAAFTVRKSLKLLRKGVRCIPPTPLCVAEGRQRERLSQSQCKHQIYKALAPIFFLISILGSEHVCPPRQCQFPCKLVIGCESPPVPSLRAVQVFRT